mmetsp:Transcript_9607/g.9264  ORF Transcript_9607/g.9264 Transcript_9607/m.9264 type:complete len:344 (-) Transcript_9607:1944-2975(-)
MQLRIFLFVFFFGFFLVFFIVAGFVVRVLALFIFFLIRVPIVLELLLPCLPQRLLLYEPLLGQHAHTLLNDHFDVVDEGSGDVLGGNQAGHPDHIHFPFIGIEELFADFEDFVEDLFSDAVLFEVVEGGLAVVGDGAEVHEGELPLQSVTHRLDPEPFRAIVQDLLEELVQGISLPEDLEEELEEDGAFCILDGHVTLDGVHGGGAHVHEHLHLGLVADQLREPMEDVLVQGVQQVPKGLLVLLKHLREVRKDRPGSLTHHGALLDEATQGKHDVVLELYLGGVYDVLKERLQRVFDLRVELGNEVGLLHDRPYHIPGLVYNDVVLFPLLMTRLDLGDDALDQ